MTAPSADLSTINKTTVRFTAWAARVTDGRSYQYSFTARKTGANVTNHKFECRLVGNNESMYVLATFTAKTEKAVATAKEKFKNGSAWIVSEVKFENTQQTYISSPHKICVDLDKSKLEHCADPDLENQLAKVLVPPRTVAETAKLTSTRHQDLLAVVTHIGPVRTTKSGNVIDVTIMDASEDSPGVFAKVLISLIGSHKHDLVQVGKALVFFNLACKIDKDDKQYTHWMDSLLCEAPPCDKHTQLTQQFEQLKDAVNTVMLTKFTPKHSVDVSGPQPIAACALLDYTAQNPAAKLPEVLQIMLATLEEPTGPVIVEGTDRIWFIGKLREFSGCVDVGVPERIALQLTGLDKASFLDAHASGTLQFPLLCNMRVSRTISSGASGSSGAYSLGILGSSGASQPSTKTFVNTTIQEAKPVDWSNNMVPNAAYQDVLSLLNVLPRNEEGLVFAFLSDIEPDPHTGFQVVFSNGNIAKGAAVAVLIASSKKSKPPFPLGSGFQVCAENVCDIACPEADAKKAAAYTVTGFCSLEDMSKFDLSPPRGHTQRFAIALISRCEETTSASQPGMKTFHMDKMQILEQSDGPKAVPVFQALRVLTMKLNPSNNSDHKHDLTIDENPDRPLKRCRTLSAMPTDESLGQ